MSKRHTLFITIPLVEEDGMRFASPLDVQYQNATVWGRLMTSFAGPMNKFILGI